MSYHTRKGREEAALVLFLFFFVLSIVKTDEKVVGEKKSGRKLISFFLFIIKGTSVLVKNDCVLM